MMALELEAASVKSLAVDRTKDYAQRAVDVG
jgi:hypothetical protein